jgi:hypothetical protein
MERQQIIAPRTGVETSRRRESSLVLERRKIRFNENGLKSRRVTLGEEEDEPEAMFARGW